MILDVTVTAGLLGTAQRGAETEKGPTPASRPIGPSGSQGAPLVSVDRASLEQAAARVHEVFQAAEPRLQIEIDPDLERVVVKIVKGETNEVIRQIPPQELLDLAKRLTAPKGFLLKEEA